MQCLRTGRLLHLVYVHNFGAGKFCEVSIVKVVCLSSGSNLRPSQTKERKRVSLREESSYPPDYSMDEFAQTRQPDNLFDDDFTPIIEPTEPPIQPPRAPRAQDEQKQYPPRQPPQQRAPNTVPENDLNNPIVTDQTQKPAAAVRGDRSATGGVNKPKLTEDELSERLAAVKLKNAKREEAHRLAEADEASFQQREAVASQKRREEGAARRAMDQEREKNRLRKLAVKGGREWDEGKEEQDLNKERASQFRRGAYGAIAYRGGRGGYGNHGAEEAATGDYSQNKGRGRGSRVGRARGGGSRGGRTESAKAENGSQNISRKEDFPSLPKAQRSVELLASPIGEKQESWADQVETVQSGRNS